MSEEEKEAIINQYEDLIQSLPGRILPKRYRIEGMLSTNPFSALFQAVYEPEEKLVTLRVFRTLIKSEEDYQYKRFKQEAKKLINMRHPNIAKVLDIGLLDEGLPYIVLENIIGPTLEQVLVHQNRVDPDQVVLIFTQVARAVQAAHDQGILHESLQPDRITITETETGDAVVRTSGFGMISMHNKLGIPLKTPKSKLTFIGTANYMSPEQCRAQPVDARSDIYALGCVMYRVLTGTAPPNFFIGYHDAAAAGAQLNAVGTMYTVTGNGSTVSTTGVLSAIYEDTSGGKHVTVIQTPVNLKGRRLSWVELR